MNKITKKLFISIITWIMIFVTLGASTYAWFSMNYQVSATDLTIKVQSNATYLLVGDNVGIATNKVGLTKECEALCVTEGNDSKQCYPAFYGDGSVLGSDEGHMVTTTPGVWYTARNLDSSSSTNKIRGITVISNNNFDDYVLTYNVYLTLSNDSLPYEKQLTVNYNKVSGDDAISVVVEIQTLKENEIEYTNESISLNSNNSRGTTEGKVYISGNTAMLVTMYVYLDGNYENINSDYFNEHNGVNGSVNISFELIP